MVAQTGLLLAPTTIKRIGRDSVQVMWNDGHESLYPNRYLRDNCPCATCREHRPNRRLPVLGNPGELFPQQIRVVGHYAIGVEWSDSHSSGIYSYATLRRLCPCGRCQIGASGA